MSLGVLRGVRRIIGARLAPFIRLDASIANRSFYIEQKNDTLIELKNRLLNAASLEQKYELSKELVSQYSNYENAPTLYYVPTNVWK